ncbi:MAG: hypothetical protein ABI969_05870 [bacterium]
MAIPKIKATYSLDEPTVKKLADIARKWNTSKSDALSRLINQTDEAARAEEIQMKLDAWGRAQKAMSHLTSEQWGQWKKDTREIHESFGPQEDDHAASEQ